MQKTLPFRDRRTIQERFEAFDKEHPHVFEKLVGLAFEAKRKGRTRLSIETLFGRLRWDMQVETNDPSGFKINDNFSSRFVRKIVRQFPELETLFELRKLRSE